MYAQLLRACALSTAQQPSMPALVMPLSLFEVPLLGPTHFVGCAGSAHEGVLADVLFDYATHICGGVRVAVFGAARLTCAAAALSGAALAGPRGDCMVGS